MAVARSSLSADIVVREALAIVDEVGMAQLTFGAVAVRVGVAAPRLYAHVDGLGELRTLIRRVILEQMSETIRSALAGVTGNAAVLALFHEVRGYALAYPFRYLAMQSRTQADPELADVAAGLLALYNSVVQSFDLEESEAMHAMRRIRAALYGFVSLELSGAFGPREDTDESFRRLADMVVASL
jgi:AcrR family transcriptional regulator